MLHNEQERFDHFLNEATHTVADMWEAEYGGKVGTNERYALNDLLTVYFTDKRSGQSDEVYQK